MNKCSPLVFALLLGMAASGALAGPVVLDDGALDMVTAGNSATVTAQAEATGNGMNITSTDTVALVREIRSNAMGTLGVVTATGGIAIAAATGDESSRSTSVASSHEQTNPLLSFEIDYTYTGIITSMSVNTEMQIGGNAFDRFRMALSNL